MSPLVVRLVVREGLAVYPIAGLPPTGEYGVDWVVVRSVDVADARRRAELAFAGYGDEGVAYSYGRAIEEFVEQTEVGVIVRGALRMASAMASRRVRP